MRRVAWIASVAVVSSLAAVGLGNGATGRDALIRPGVGIGKVRLGMTQSQVRAAMGRHDVARTQDRGFRERYVELVWEGGGDPNNYRTVGLLGRPGALRVVLITTTRLTERTPNGYGPGSRTRSLRNVPGVRCQNVSSADGRFERNELVVRSTAGETVFVPGGWVSSVEDTTKTIEWVIVRRPGIETDLRFSSTPCRPFFAP